MSTPCAEAQEALMKRYYIEFTDNTFAYLDLTEEQVKSLSVKSHIRKLYPAK